MSETLPPNGPQNPFTDDEAGLHDLLLEQAGTIDTLERSVSELSRENDEYQRRALRYEEGLALLDWHLSRFMADAEVVVTAELVLRWTAEIDAYARCGASMEPGWMRAARKEMGR